MAKQKWPTPAGGTSRGSVSVGQTIKVDDKPKSKSTSKLPQKKCGGSMKK